MGGGAACASGATGLQSRGLPVGSRIGHPAAGQRCRRYPARDIKAAAFRQMGYASININWRNWYLTSAMELEGALEQRLAAVDMRAVFLPPDIVAALPTAAILHSMTSRLKAEQALVTQQTLAIGIEDEAAVFGLQIHRGVCRFIEGAPPRQTSADTGSEHPERHRYRARQFCPGPGHQPGETHGQPRRVPRLYGTVRRPWQNKPSLTLR